MKNTLTAPAVASATPPITPMANIRLGPRRGLATVLESSPIIAPTGDQLAASAEMDHSLSTLHA